MVVVEISGCERSERLIVEAVWRSRSGFDDIAFVQLEFYFSGHVFLGGFHECLNCFAQRGEPFSFVYDLGELAAQFFLCLKCLAVKDQLLELVVCFHEDGSARSFINAAGFHAHYAVFDDINNTDAVFSTKHIQLRDNFRNFHLFAV